MRGNKKGCLSHGRHGRDPDSVQRFREKEMEKYRNDAAYRNGFRTRQNARRYEITVEEYEERRLQPCGICGRYDPPAGRGQGMHIDHDHHSNALRGTLCAKCNRGLGSFDDSEDLLTRAAAYLASWRPR